MKKNFLKNFFLAKRPPTPLGTFFWKKIFLAKRPPTPIGAFYDKALNSHEEGEWGRVFFREKIFEKFFAKKVFFKIFFKIVFCRWFYGAIRVFYQKIEHAKKLDSTGGLNPRPLGSLSECALYGPERSLVQTTGRNQLFCIIDFLIKNTYTTVKSPEKHDFEIILKK